MATDLDEGSVAAQAWFRLDAVPQDDVAAARQSALTAQAAFRRQLVIDAIARASDAVAQHLMQGPVRRDRESMIPLSAVPGIPATLAPVRADGAGAARVQPVAGGDPLRGQQQR